MFAGATWKHLKSATESTIIFFDLAKGAFSIIREKQITAPFSLYSPFPR
jgi:hypothetical protein